MKRDSSLLLAAAVTAVLLPRTEANGQGLEEIVVTAQKRAESAQDVPIAIDVITGDTFLREGVRDVEDMGKMSTELEINSSVGQANLIGLRGLQQLVFAPTNEGLASVHLDGLFIGGFHGFNGMVHDLERVEVLAGPQGTLYGRNAVAGAINLITRLPGSVLEGNASVEAGSYDLRRFTGGVTLPVSDSFAVRLAGQKLTRDSFFTAGTGEQDWWSGRLSAVWNPSDADKVVFRADYSDFGGTNDAATLLAVNADARTQAGAVPASVANFQNSPTLQDPYDNVPYRNQRNVANFIENEQELQGISLEYSHAFDSFSSVLLVGHREIDGVARGPERVASNAFGNIYPIVQDTSTAELRFLSSDSRRLAWVLGFFWYEVDTIGGNFIPTGTNGSYTTAGLDVPICPCIGTAFFPNNSKGESWAAFSQATWTPAANERLHLTAGLRYSIDRKSGALGFSVGNVAVTAFGLRSFPVEARPLFAGLSDLAPNGDNSSNWSKFTWRLGLDYDVTDSAMVYGSVSTGYKAGTYTFGATPALNPENLLAFEVGLKSRILGNRLQLNSSLWWYKHEDMEALVVRSLDPQYWVVVNGNPISTSFSTANIGAADLGGASADIEWLPTDNDRAGLSFTYTYSRITDGNEAGRPDTVIFNVGERVGDAPKWQVIGRYGRTIALPNWIRS